MILFKIAEKYPFDKDQNIKYAKVHNKYLDFFEGKYEKI